MKPLISCRDAVRELWRYLDEELKAVDHEHVEEHLDRCVHCCGELEFVRQMQQVLRSQHDLDIPADVQQRLEGLIDELTHPERSGK